MEGQERSSALLQDGVRSVGCGAFILEDLKRRARLSTPKRFARALMIVRWHALSLVGSGGSVDGSVVVAGVRTPLTA